MSDVILTSHFLQRVESRSGQDGAHFPTKRLFKVFPALAKIASHHEPLRCCSDIGGNWHVVYKYDRAMKSLVIVTVLPPGKGLDYDSMSAGTRLLTRLIPIELSE